MNFSKTLSQPVKILVVDDHPNTAALLARAISKIGPSVEVLAATSGHEALECLQGSPADILITDVDMPAMTGLELIEKLREHPAGGPTFSFLLTASHIPGLKIAARRLEVREVLQKPIHPQYVCQIVRQALDEMDLSKLYKELVSIKKFKILIADDEPSNVTLLSRYLDAEGYAYITAKNGTETLEKARSEHPDLVLLNINNPFKDDLAVLQEIRTDPATGHIPTIILSAAWSNKAEIHLSLDLVADAYITKPIERRELLTLIRTRLLAIEVEKAKRAQQNLLEKGKWAPS